MALARRGATATKKKGRKYRKKHTWKNTAKKAAMGGAAGLAVSIPLTLAAKFLNKPVLREVGQRGGAIVSSAAGGTPGEVLYQAIDAVADRIVSVPGYGNITGTNQVYL